MRFRSVSIVALGLAALGLGLGGCGKSSDVTGVGKAAQQAADDLAIEIGAATAVDPGGMMTELEGTSAAVPSALAPAGLESVMAADTTFTRGPFTITLERTFYDVDDNALQAWDPSATRAVVTSWVRGAITGARYQATVGRSGSLDVNGLAAALDTLVFEGTAIDTTDARYTSLDGSRTVDVHVQATRVLTGVRTLKNRDVNPWPLAGTATWRMSVDKYAEAPRGGLEAHFDAVVVVTFDGTSTADVSINGRYRYRLNLQTGAVARG